MQKTQVLAEVGNRQITREDVDTLLNSLNPQTAMQFRSEQGMKELVKELANQELFYLDAVENGIDKDEEFVQELERAKANILKKYALDKLLNGLVVPENEIVNYYLANKSEFAEAPSVKASHVLVDELEKAEEIAAEIKGGLSFEDAAAKYSKCPSGKSGGDLGYFPRGMMVPEFENHAFSMEKDEISAPVKTQFGYHLIKLYDKKGEGLKSIDEVRDQIGEQLMAEKQQEMYQHKIGELRSKYTVKFNV